MCGRGERMRVQSGRSMQMRYDAPTNAKRGLTRARAGKTQCVRQSRAPARVYVRRVRKRKEMARVRRSVAVTGETRVRHAGARPL